MSSGIATSADRVARFTSSNISKLMTNGKGHGGMGAAGVTYIAEKRMEKRLGRSLNADRNSKPTSWGLLLEAYVTDVHMKNDHALISRKTLPHPLYHEWAGSPDMMYADIVVDIKCPFTLKSFCEMVDSFESVEKFKKERPEYYWQLVSNAIITDMPKCEIIVFVPYYKEVASIMGFLHDTDVLNTYHLNAVDYQWLDYADTDELPYLIEGGHYQNLNRFEFEVPESDFEALTNRVKLAIELLNKP